MPETYCSLYIYAIQFCVQLCRCTSTLCICNNRRESRRCIVHTLVYKNVFLATSISEQVNKKFTIWELVNHSKTRNRRAYCNGPLSSSKSGDRRHITQSRLNLHSATTPVFRVMGSDAGVTWGRYRLTTAFNLIDENLSELCTFVLTLLTSDIYPIITHFMRRWCILYAA